MKREIMNPVIKGFAPDPSILRVGEDYYIATSTFEWFPGVTIYHSRDLVNWEFVNAPLDNVKMMDLRGIDSACGIWAPNLTYCDGVFYLLYTIVYTNRSRFKDTHNFLVTATDIKGSFSEPVFLNCSGFDPSLFHDGKKKWLVNMTVDHRVEKNRFSGIDIQEFDEKAGTLKGEIYRIFRGTEIGKTEGPNMFKKDDWYFLVCAEGGTESGHCVTVVRSKNITGPYEVDPENPMLSSAGDASLRIQRAGHGQLVTTPEGMWYMAHLCSRPIDGYSVLGRECALQNIEWTKDGWFRLKGGRRVPGESFFIEANKENTEQINGDYSTCDQRGQCYMNQRQLKEFVDFEEDLLPWQFLTLRESAKACGISLSDRKGFARIYGGNSLASKYKQGFFARRQQSFFYDCIVKMEFEPRNYQHMAGLVCYYNYDNYHYLHVGFDEVLGTCIMITTVENKEITETEPIKLPEMNSVYFLKAEVRAGGLQLYYSIDGKTYERVGETLNMLILSDEHVDGNGFTGAMVGCCCQDLLGNGVYADFDWFSYEESGEDFKKSIEG